MKVVNQAMKRAFINAAKGASSRSKVVRTVKQALGWTGTVTGRIPAKK